MLHKEKAARQIPRRLVARRDEAASSIFLSRSESSPFAQGDAFGAGFTAYYCQLGRG
jgi:hypothetical protein